MPGLIHTIETDLYARELLSKTGPLKLLIIDRFQNYRSNSQNFLHYFDGPVANRQIIGIPELHSDPNIGILDFLFQDRPINSHLLRGVLNWFEIFFPRKCRIGRFDYLIQDLPFSYELVDIARDVKLSEVYVKLDTQKKKRTSRLQLARAILSKPAEVAFLPSAIFNVERELLDRSYKQFAADGIRYSTVLSVDQLDKDLRLSIFYKFLLNHHTHLFLNNVLDSDFGLGRSQVVELPRDKKHQLHFGW